MSTSIYWEPIEKRKEQKDITDQLKYIFAPRFWGHDGSLRGEEYILTQEDLSYLSGVSDGSRDTDVREGIKILIDAINKYGAVKIWLE